MILIQGFWIPNFFNRIQLPNLGQKALPFGSRAQTDRQTTINTVTQERADLRNELHQRHQLEQKGRLFEP